MYNCVLPQTGCSSSLPTHNSHILSNARKINPPNQLMFNCGDFEYNYHHKQGDRSEEVVYMDGCVCVFL